MSTDEVVKLLCELEERLLQPSVRESPNVLANLLADDFVEFGSSGRVYNRLDIIVFLAKEQGEGTGAQVTMSDFNVRMLSDGLALVTYRTDYAGGAASRRSFYLEDDRCTLANGFPSGNGFRFIDGDSADKPLRRS
jgi:hypothetical protein